MVRPDASIARVTTGSYTIPTDEPESDGTLAWDRTTLVAVHVTAAGETGFGYTYCNTAAARLIDGTLAPEIHGLSAFDVEAAWNAMVHIVRNIGWPGIGACAISAVDLALWDLKARLLGIPLALLLGQARPRAPVYGSGGFTSYSNAQLVHQLARWAEQGCAWVKMKVGREPERDSERVAAAKGGIGSAALFVDANGAYSRKQALGFAKQYAGVGVKWFEEPVSSDDLEGLNLLRNRGPAGLDIAAGEYGYTPHYFRRMLKAGAVDVLQADCTRCGGITGFLRVAALCDAFQIPLSSHCAPSAHLPATCAAPRLRHMEWFHDHVRIEHMLFDGAPALSDGHIAPDPSRPGNGLAFRHKDAEKFEA
jgi:L-alanine-DL-glutamate epimerase-like enolase superfamily enzyme